MCSPIPEFNRLITDIYQTIKPQYSTVNSFLSVFNLYLLKNLIFQSVISKNNKENNISTVNTTLHIHSKAISELFTYTNSVSFYYGSNTKCPFPDRLSSATNFSKKGLFFGRLWTCGTQNLAGKFRSLEQALSAWSKALCAYLSLSCQSIH